MRQKIRHLSLVVEQRKNGCSTTSKLDLPEECLVLKRRLRTLSLRSNHSMVKKSKLNTHAALMHKHHVI